MLTLHPILPLAGVLALVGTALASPVVAPSRAKNVLGFASFVIGGGLLLFGDKSRVSVDYLEILVPVFAISLVSVIAVSLSEPIRGLVSGVLDKFFSRKTLKLKSLFNVLYWSGVFISSALNNDAMIMLMMPIAISTISNLNLTGRSRSLLLLTPFWSIGIAPFLLANPINVLLASATGIDYGSYTFKVSPIFIAGVIMTWAILSVLYRKELNATVNINSANRSEGKTIGRAVFTRILISMLPLLVIPFVSAILPNAFLWCALLSAIIALSYTSSISGVIKRVDWSIPVFLLALQICTPFLVYSGSISELTRIYNETGASGITLISVLGSAILNNHTMTAVNSILLSEVDLNMMDAFLSAVIGGDLGPRLIPTGSLAGLLWMSTLMQSRERIPFKEFFIMGLILSAMILPVLLLLL